MTPGELDTLIIQALSGDMHALEKLYHELEGCVYALALSILRDHAAAQDVTQDTFVRLCTSGATYKPKGMGKAWVLTIARNLALRVYNHNSRYADISQLPDSFFSDQCQAENEQQNRLLLKTALARLGAEERQIVLLHVSGLKHDEIAPIMKRPASTIRWKYAQAVKKLAAWMDGGREETAHEN